MIIIFTINQYYCSNQRLISGTKTTTSKARSMANRYDRTALLSLSIGTPLMPKPINKFTPTGGVQNPIKTLIIKIIGIEIVDASRHIALERLLPVKYEILKQAV
jgi:hypothetical protein